MGESAYIVKERKVKYSEAVINLDRQQLIDLFWENDYNGIDFYQDVWWLLKEDIQHIDHPDIKTMIEESPDEEFVIIEWL